MDTTRLIEKYLEGSLSETERHDVEEKADRDAGFRKLIDLHREVNESINDDDLHDLHEKINSLLNYQMKHENSGSRFSRFMPLFKIAAILILIAGSAVIVKIWLAGNPEERLFNKYYKPYEADLITRADDSSNKLSEAVVLYNQKSFDEAYNIFSQITTSEQTNYIAWFFRGVTSMQKGDFNNALKSFSAIPDSWNNPYNEHRAWYQALALLHEQKTAQAIMQFEKISIEKGFYSQQSDLILSALRR